jgi:hypothetical protein
VTFENADDATQAIESSNEKEWQVCPLPVAFCVAAQRHRTPL